MQTLNEVLDRKSETVSSPDGNIIVTLNGGTITDVEFLTGTYSRYKESTMEYQLVSLIKLIIVSRNRMRREAIAELSGNEVREGNPMERSSQQIEFQKRLEDIEGEAHSDRVSVYARPLDFWDVEIQPDSLQESSGEDFVEEVLTLASAAISDMEMKVTRANNDVFGHISSIK